MSPFLQFKSTTPSFPIGGVQHGDDLELESLSVLIRYDSDTVTSRISYNEKTSLHFIKYFNTVFYILKTFKPNEILKHIHCTWAS